jgi:hypothetical protein
MTITKSVMYAVQLYWSIGKSWSVLDEFYSPDTARAYLRENTRQYPQSKFRLVKRVTRDYLYE